MKTGDKSPEDGFSLVEVLVVLAILGMLLGIVAPKAISYLSGAKSKTAKIQITHIEAALDLYAIDVGSYPTQEQGLKALLAAPPNSQNWAGPYLAETEIPLDPWGRAFIYSVDAQTPGFKLQSLGSDGEKGGYGEAEDISN